MTKRKTLDLAAITEAGGEPPKAIDAIAPAPKAEAKTTSRAGRVQVGAYVLPELRTRLKVRSAETGTKINDLIEDALIQYLDRTG